MEKERLEEIQKIVEYQEQWCKEQNINENIVVIEERELLDEIERLNNIIDDKKERIEIAIKLLIKLFGTDDMEINYVIGILNGNRQIHFETYEINGRTYTETY